MKTKQEAIKAAKEILKKVNGYGWKVSVNKNMGWYWCLENLEGRLTLWPNHTGEKFNCMFSTEARSGCPGFYDIRYFQDPNDAIIATLKQASEYANKYMNLSAKAQSFHKELINEYLGK